jgi:type IV secretory pathway TrbF-like protein
MRASFDIAIVTPTREEAIRVNPLGVFVVDLNWTQQL